MNKYNVNLIYDDNSILNINDLLVKILNDEIRSLIHTTLKNNQSELKSNCTHLSLHNKEDE